MWVVGLFLSGIVHSVQADEACKFSYLGFPEDLNDSQVVVPEDVVAMSDFIPVGTPTEIIEQFIGGTPSIVFILDNSSSMFSDMDPDGARFSVTEALVDTILTINPKAQIGLVVFGTTLYFEPGDDVLFKTCPAPDVSGGYIPLLTLNETYQSTLAGNKTGYEILKYYLRTKIMFVNMVCLEYQPFGALNNSSTNIYAGFEAAKDGMLASPYPKKDHYIVFFSDGEATAGGANQNAFIAGTNVPTTFTVFFTPQGQAPQSLLDMTQNIKTNGYSNSNYLTNLWAIEAGHDALLKLLMDNAIGQIINHVFTAEPITITINGIDPVTGWNDTGFTFDDLFPLTGETTDFTFEIGYTVFKDSITANGDTVQIEIGDTTHNVNFDVVIQDGAVVSDKLNIECWDRVLAFYYNGSPVTLVDETMNSLEVRFTESMIDVWYGYEDVSAVVTHAQGTTLDVETFDLEDKGTYFSYTFVRKIASPNSGDGILQHQAADSIIAIFRNPKLPLDTLRIAVPFRLSGAVMMQNAIYFDNDAEGFVDSIFIGLSGTKIEENLDELVDVITLPGHRNFEVTDYSYVNDGIALNVTERATLPQTYVTWEDFLLITDTLFLQNGGWLLPTLDTIRIIDSIAPIIMKASLIDSIVTIMSGQNDSLTGLGTDELTVIFSETVEALTEERPFKYYSNGEAKEFSAKLSLLSQNANMGRFKVDALYGVNSIVDQDSIWVNWALADNVYDAIGNEQDNPQNIRRPIEVTVVNVLIKGPYELVLKATQLDPDEGLALPDYFTGNPDIMEMLEYVSVEGDGDYQGIMIIMLEPDVLENAPEDQGYAATLSLYDGVGNTILRDEDMAYVKKIKSLVYLWDGRNMQGRYVGPGGYLAYTTIDYLNGSSRQVDYQKKNDEVRKLVVGVRK